MSNIERANGFHPYEEPDRESPYTAGGTVYPGDLVRMNSSGLIVAAAADQTANIGVAANYATTGQTVNVWDEPEQKFTVQAGGSTDLEQSACGLNYQIIATIGDTTYRQSRMELDSTSGATTPATLPLRMLAVQPVINNSPGVHAKVVVSINNHQLRPGTVGV